MDAVDATPILVIRLDSENRSVVFCTSDQRKIESGTGRTRLFRRQTQERLHRDLVAFASAFAAIGGDWTPARKSALLGLIRSGEQLLVDTFPGQLGEVEKLRAFFRAFSSKAQREGSGHFEDTSPLVEVDTGTGAFFPAEILPLFASQELVEAAERGAWLEGQAPLEVARAFLGFSALIKRYSVFGPKYENPQRAEARRLRVKFFQHGGLVGARHEFLRLRQLGATVDGPWPSRGSVVKGSAFEAARQIAAENEGFDGHPQAEPVRVLHFACHQRSNSLDSLKHALLLRGEEYWFRIPSVVEVSLQQVELALKGMASSREGGRTGPLVFINACESCRALPEDSHSWPELFLEYNFRGFIGLPIMINDRVAARFSAEFYERLLQGKSVGCALSHARQELLRVDRNALGLLYFSYADPALGL
ncbi:MAG TPA: CHAT domain-containing protein [Thermoanaerobaculia bacterium]|nr:CHAT domain-containing protein [Thermoanaerobaculia bacterium]